MNATLSHTEQSGSRRWWTCQREDGHATHGRSCEPCALRSASRNTAGAARKQSAVHGNPGTRTGVLSPWHRRQKQWPPGREDMPRPDRRTCRTRMSTPGEAHEHTYQSDLCWRCGTAALRGYSCSASRLHCSTADQALKRHCGLPRRCPRLGGNGRTHHTRRTLRSFEPHFLLSELLLRHHRSPLATQPRRADLVHRVASLR